MSAKLMQHLRKCVLLELYRNHTSVFCNPVPGPHPDGFEDAESGWPRVLKRFAAEAWRRADAGELADNELYCTDAAWSGLYDRIHTQEPDEMDRRLALAADFGESLHAWRFHQSETVGSDVADSRARQQRYGIGAGKIISASQNHRLASESNHLRQTRFYFFKTQTRHFCGRLFLAWLPETCDQAEKQCGVLAKKICPQQTTGRTRNPNITKNRLARNSDLGMFVETAPRILR